MRGIVTLMAGGAMALMLVGCSSDPDTDGDGKISAEEARAEMANNAVKPEPGQYKVTMTFKSAEIPGAPPEMMDMLGKSMSNTMEYCLTKEEADKGFEDSLTKGQGDNCTIERLKMDGGKIDMAMKCDEPATGPMQMTMNGEVTPTSADLTMKMEGKVANSQNAKIEMNMKQQRIGDCTQ